MVFIYNDPTPTSLRPASLQLRSTCPAKRAQEIHLHFVFDFAIPYRGGRSPNIPCEEVARDLRNNVKGY
jgi:hypothetical protein